MLVMPPVPQPTTSSITECSPEIGNQESCILNMVLRKRMSLSLLTEFFRAHSEVNEIENLPANWDSYGASPISTDVSRNAKQALDTLLCSLPYPDVTPNPNGTLSLEWESSNGFAYIEIGNSKFSAFIRPNLGQSYHFDGNAESIDFNIGPFISAILFPSPSTIEGISGITIPSDNGYALA